MSNKARVLIYDIETSPNLGYVWGMYEQNVIQYESEWHMLSFAYKWLGERTTHVVTLADFKGYEKDMSNDYNLVATLWELFNEADVIIAHNGDAFDQKKSNARFAVHGFTPPSPYKQIDTLKVARKYFKFNSNKLGDLGAILGLGRKAETGGFATWLGCMRGDPKAWAKMAKYNKQDVVLLEKVYLKLRPWMDNHPAMNLLSGNMTACPKCTRGPLQKRGTSITKTLTYQRYQCTACGGWSRSRLADSAPEKVHYVN
jgi:hypothetical protein